MQTLSGLDATFLYLETPQMPMHVGSFCLYALPATPRYSFHKAVTAHIGARMHLAEVFSRKLGLMPAVPGAHPAADAAKVAAHRTAKSASGSVRRALGMRRDRGAY